MFVLKRPVLSWQGLIHEGYMVFQLTTVNPRTPRAVFLEPFKAIKRWLWPDVLKDQSTSVSRAKKAIADYKAATGQSEGLAELMVFYCECAAGFSNSCCAHQQHDRAARGGGQKETPANGLGDGMDVLSTSYGVDD
jgi:hypothetical protein